MPRVSIKKYKNSPFEYLYNSLNDQAIINGTVHDYHLSDILIEKIELYFEYYILDVMSCNITMKIC